MQYTIYDWRGKKQKKRKLLMIMVMVRRKKKNEKGNGEKRIRKTKSLEIMRTRDGAKIARRWEREKSVYIIKEMGAVRAERRDITGGREIQLASYMLTWQQFYFIFFQLHNYVLYLFHFFQVWRSWSLLWSLQENEIELKIYCNFRNASEQV